MNTSTFMKVVLVIILAGGIFAGGFFVGKAGPSNTDVKDDPKGMEVGMDGPSAHSVWFAYGSSLDSWTLADSPIAEQASVPDLVLLDQPLGDFDKRTLFTIFVNGDVSDTAFLHVSYSNDQGKTWADPEDVEFEGLDESIVPVDPSIVQLADGTLMLYFLDLPSPEEEATTSVYYAISDDGIHFTVEDKAFSSDTFMTDPDVIYFKNKWFMYLMCGQGMCFATSDDGLTFEESENEINESGGVPGTIIQNDTLYLFGCLEGVSYVTSSDGENFDNLIRADGFFDENGEYAYCDPSPVIFEDGSFAMVVKQLPMANPVK